MKGHETYMLLKMVIHYIEFRKNSVYNYVDSQSLTI